MPLPQPDGPVCGAKATVFGEVQTCGKSPGHTDGGNASRRVHQDFATGHRWPTTLDDDPLRDFVHYQSKEYS